MAPRGRGANPEYEAAARCAQGYRLRPGQQIASRLAEGAVHVYRIAREKGEVLDAVVEQRGVDVAVALRAPSGRELIEVNSPNGTKGPEPIFWVAGVRGNYCLEVKAGNSEGNYTVGATRPQLASPADSLHAEAALLFNQGEQARKKSNTHLAISNYEKALALWEALGDELQQGITLYRLGGAQQESGKIAEAISLFLRAKPLLRDHPIETASLLNWLGGAYAREGRTADGFELLQQSLKIGQSTGDLPTQAVAFDLIGRQYRQWGEYDNARVSLEQSLRAWQEFGHTPRNQARCLNDLAGLDLDLGRPEEAYERSRLALEAEQAAEDPTGASVSLRQMGDAQIVLGEPHRALPLLERSVETAKAAKNEALKADNLISLGYSYLAMGKLDRAFVAFENARDLVSGLDAPGSAALATAALAGVACQRGDWRAALLGFNQARADFERIGDRSAVAATLYGRALAHRSAHLLLEARADLEEALPILEALRLKPATGSSRASFLSVRHASSEMYVDVLMLLARGHSDRDLERLAFEASERARSRAFLDELGEAANNIRVGVDPVRLARATELGRRLAALESRRMALLGDRSDTRQQRSNVEEEIQSTVEERDRLRGEIRRLDPLYAGLIQPHLLTLPEVQEGVLEDGTALLAYALGDERSYLWLIRRGSFVSRELAPRLEIETAAKNLHNALAKRFDEATVRAATAKLSQLILAPIAGELGQDRLVVVADGALQYIPFGALHLSANSAGGEMSLIDEHEVVSLPSASIAAVLHNEIAIRTAPAKWLMGFADPVFTTEDERIDEAFRKPASVGTASSELADVLRSARDVGLSRLVRLKHSGEEARGIFRFVPPGMGRLALGFDATRELALDDSLQQYRILHFATHALLDTRHPALSGIALSLVDRRGRPRNGFLPVYEIYNLHLPVDLVVLSACETALGKDVKGEGLIGLTRGFMYAGAPRVVVSLWNVSDKGTAEFMQRFYRNMLVTGLKPAAALRAAQISISVDSNWSAPYYWAGFVLQGEWR